MLKHLVFEIRKKLAVMDVDIQKFRNGNMVAGTRVKDTTHEIEILCKRIHWQVNQEGGTKKGVRRDNQTSPRLKKD